MGNIMNTFYYGKAGQADYTPDRLPKNRVALFFEVLRIRFSGLFMVNLLFVAFLIPAIIVTYYAVILLYSSVDAETGAVIFDFIGEGYLSLYLMLMIPCLALAGVGASGTTYVLRNWARDQHSFVFSDFKDSLKSNWKMGLLIGLFDGLALFITYICSMYYGQMASTNVLFVVPQMLVIVFCAIWLMMNMVMFPMVTMYDMKLMQVIRNSLIIVVARLPWSLLFFGGSVLIPIVILFFVPYGTLIFILLYLLIGFSLTGLVYASYANSCFDRFLNPKIEGAPVNMGLRDPIYDELDKDDEDEETNANNG